LRNSRFPDGFTAKTAVAGERQRDGFRAGAAGIVIRAAPFFMGICCRIGFIIYPGEDSTGHYTE